MLSHNRPTKTSIVCITLSTRSGSVSPAVNAAGTRLAWLYAALEWISDAAIGIIDPTKEDAMSAQLNVSSSLEVRLLIAGAWVAGSEEDWLPVIDPSTGDPV